jgi:hypothetical protein
VLGLGKITVRGLPFFAGPDLDAVGLDVDVRLALDA